MSTWTPSGPSQQFMDLAAMRCETLSEAELFWCSKQSLLEANGYMLTARLRPGWAPSWKADGITDFERILKYEDSNRGAERDDLVYATRIKDDKLVFIKRLEKKSTEVSIASMLVDSDVKSDPMNHSVPISRVIEDPENPSYIYMVMPFIRSINDPNPEMVQEVVDFCDQILEGLVFMHRNHVAHRDCAVGNIMMDASAYYPEGHHPVLLSHLPHDITKYAPVIPRIMQPPKYYFIDYGISVFIPSSQEKKLVVGTDGRDQDVPELSNDVPYDPFKVDICIIGNLLKTHFYDQYFNVDFLLPLIQAMTERDPNKRPNAEQALAIWRSQRKRLWIAQRVWRLYWRAIDPATRRRAGWKYLPRALNYLVYGLPPIFKGERCSIITRAIALCLLPLAWWKGTSRSYTQRM